jgi:uncharacterized protein
MDDFVRKVIERFRMVPHPEGGFYREVWRAVERVRHPGVPEGLDPRRSAGTHIQWAIGAGDFSAFHRVRWTDEVWHLYAGGPLEIHLIRSDGSYEKRLLATDLGSGEPTTVVPAGCWQAARLAPGASWGFCGCTVAPGFDFADLEMASAADLQREHPRHISIVRELTRP